MGKPQYPRRGERIAPALLRDVLLSPLPAGLIAATSGRYKVLADLDETVWQFATPAVCRRLAEAVVAHLQPRLPRLPLVVSSQKLPLPRSLVQLADLPIGRRAFNCLQALVDDDVRKLAAVEIGAVARRPGMGAKSLLDLLCALEDLGSLEKTSTQLQFGEQAMQHEQPVPARPEELPSRLEVEISRYPRVGQTLAPKALGFLLNLPLGDRRMPTLRLKDLDETVWDKFGSETCLRFAKVVVARVRSSALRLGKVGAIPIPLPRTNGTPLRIQLEPRTRNCLENLGLIKNPSRLAWMTVGDLLQSSGFGIRCLLDLLSALESHIPALYQITTEVTAAARRLNKTQGVNSVGDDDPRFGPEVQSLKGHGRNLKHVTEHILGSNTCPMAPKHYLTRLNRLRDRVRAVKRLSLEEELEDLLSFDPKGRDRDIALMLFGWSGSGPRTLEQIGYEFGMTRERVRQICERHQKRLEGKCPYLPVLDRALAAAAAETPCVKSQVENALHEQGFTKGRFLIEGLIQAAQMTSRACPFVLESVEEQLYAVPASARGIAKLIGHIARKAISHWGVATIEDIAAQSSTVAGKEVPMPFAHAVLTAQNGFRWLDRASGWFWLESTARNALLNQIGKVLAACDRIHVGELRAGVSRNHRREGFAPPQRVLLELCAQSTWCHVEGSFVSAPSLDPRFVLSQTERVIVSILKENGNILPRVHLEELCLSQGLKRDTFYVNLSYSPVIARYAPGVYGVRGAPIPPGRAESLVEPRRKTRVLADYGWLPDGRVFVSYKLSEGALSNGIVTVPAGMKTYLQGEFRLLLPDGELVGQLVIKDTQAWGLGPFFRRRGGEPGDFFQIVFDTKTRKASVVLAEPIEESDK